MATGGLLRQRADRNCWSNQSFTLQNKENFKINKQHEAQYLYADPSFVMQSTEKNYDRLKGGCVQKEIFYDCHPSDGEQVDEPGILQRQLQIFEVINEIKNPKEFKGLLKQMAYTSNVLYQTFRQAYRKTKRCKVKQQVASFEMTSADQLDRGDMNPWHIINIEVPTSRHEYLEDVRYEPAVTATEKQTNRKSASFNKYLKQQKCECYMCEPCAEFEGVGICCAKCSQKSLKTENPEYFEDEIENIKNGTTTGVMESTICQQFEEELQHLSFCDRCAVLKGEMVLPAKMKEEHDTFQDVNNVKTPSSNITQPKSYNELERTNEQVFNLRPVCVDIPLKLQIDGNKLQSLSMETEAKHETQNISNDRALTEILEMMKKHMPSFKETFQDAKMHSKGTQISPSEISKSLEPKTPTSRTNFTQTLETISPALAAQSTPTSSQLDSQMKAKKLRAELLEEVRAALDKTATKEALKTLQEVKRFSLPTNLRRKETPNIRPARYSVPSNYSAIPARAASLRTQAPLSLTTFGGLKSEDSRKPQLPPKPAITPKPVLFGTETLQTDSATIKPRDHNKRNEIRYEIQEELKELLEQNSPTSTKAKYKDEERDEILLDLHKLFHPEKAEKLSKQISPENALQDIQYLLEAEVENPESAQNPKTSESKESILQSIKYILNPKSMQNPSKKKKYSKDTKEKILEDLHKLLIPRAEKLPGYREIRNSVLEDLRFMLNTGQQTTMPSSQGPGYSGAQQVKQERQKNPPNDIRDSVIGDLKYLLDLTSPPQSSSTLQENLAATREAAKNVPFMPKSATSSDASLSGNEKDKLN